MRRHMRFQARAGVPGIVRSRKSGTAQGGVKGGPGIDIGFTTTVYGCDAEGNFVEIDEADAAGLPSCKRHPPWPTEQ